MTPQEAARAAYQYADSPMDFWMAVLATGVMLFFIVMSACAAIRPAKYQEDMDQW